MSTPGPAPRPDAADRYLADVYRRHEEAEARAFPMPYPVTAEMRAARFRSRLLTAVLGALALVVVGAVALLVVRA